MAFFFQGDWKEKLLINSYTQLCKSETFDARCEVDPFHMVKDEWNIIQRTLNTSTTNEMMPHIKNHNFSTLLNN